MPDAGCWIPDAGCWIPDAGCWIPDAGYLIPDAGYLIPDAGYLIPDTGYLIPVIDKMLFTIFFIFYCQKVKNGVNNGTYKRTTLHAACSAKPADSNDVNGQAETSCK
jgi:hypothetical protein